MAKRKSQRVMTVIAHLPASVELTKRNSANAITVEVRTADELLGTLYMGRGSVEWWPSGNKTKALKKGWRDFANILDTHMRPSR
jgi:hypothetical protein